MQDENRELFKRALSEAIDMKIHEIEEEAEDMKVSPPSRRHKIRMNRLFPYLFLLKHSRTARKDRP